MKDTADPTVLSENPGLKAVAERAAHGRLDLTVRTEGLGTMPLAEPNAMFSGKGWAIIESEDTDNTTAGCSDGDEMYSI